MTFRPMWARPFDVFHDALGCKPIFTQDNHLENVIIPSHGEFISKLRPAKEDYELYKSEQNHLMMLNFGTF